MIALFLIPVLIVVYLYILRHLLRWLAACSRFFQKKAVKAVIAVVCMLAGFSHLIAFYLPSCGVKRTMQLVSNYWLGVLLYTLCTLVTADVVRLILKKCRFSQKEKLFSRKGHIVCGGICLAVIAGFCTAGVIGAKNIRTTEYAVTIDKDAGDISEMKIVLIADLHMGYSIGCSHIEKMVEKINAQTPDLVVIAGDIFDNSYDALEDPDRLAEILSGIESKYGVYAVYGNHDVVESILMGFTFDWSKKKENDPRMDAFLEDAGITLLKDEGVLVADSFYLYGRPDYRRPGTDTNTRLSAEEITAGMDTDKPIIVIDHEPRELDELADAGVDLDLCGHTHDGQLFPGNLTIDLMWENAYGCIQKGDMTNIVTSGVGVFGPYMRVGTKSEICTIQVKFNGSESE